LPPKRALKRGLAYAVLAVVLLLGGFPAHRSAWLGNADLHTWIETISTLLALVTGAMALVRSYAKKSGTFLFSVPASWEAPSSMAITRWPRQIVHG